MKSIRRFMMISLLVAISLVTITAAAWTYYDVLGEIEDLLDGQLVEAAHILRRLVTRDASRRCLIEFEGLVHNYQGTLPPGTNKPIIPIVDESFPFYHHNYAIRRVFQVWSDDGVLLLKSLNAPDFPLSSHVEGFSQTKIGNDVWYVFTLRVPPYGLRFQVAQLQDIRLNLGRTIATGHVYPIIMFFPLLAAFIWVAIGHGLKQIKKVADDVKQLHYHEELTPVDIRHVPKEISPLVVEVNNLFKRLRKAFERETRFTADAAHELRTPLAAVRMQTQVALRAQDEQSRQVALENIIQGVDRCTHVVEQLSTLNTIRPDQPLVSPEVADLNILASETIADLANKAIEKHIDISFEAHPAPSLVLCNVTLLRILLRNLVDNAIRYTPLNGEVKVTISLSENTVSLYVADNGPGIPDELRERVFERFYRQLGSKATGSGLGLSIVTQIVEVHQAAISIQDGLGGKGACFVVEFPKYRENET